MRSWWTPLRRPDELSLGAASLSACLQVRARTSPGLSPWSPPLYAAGVVSADVNSHYGKLLGVQQEYAPYGIGTGLSAVGQGCDQGPPGREARRGCATLLAKAAKKGGHP